MLGTGWAARLFVPQCGTERSRVCVRFLPLKRIFHRIPRRGADVTSIPRSEVSDALPPLGPIVSRQPTAAHGLSYRHSFLELFLPTQKRIAGKRHFDRVEVWRFERSCVSGRRRWGANVTSIPRKELSNMVVITSARSCA